MRLIDADNYCKKTCRCNSEKCDTDKCPINTEPIAYDAEKVAERIEAIMDDESIRFADQVIRAAVRIVKEGGVNEQ